MQTFREMSCAWGTELAAKKVRIGERETEGQKTGRCPGTGRVTGFVDAIP